MRSARYGSSLLFVGCTVALLPTTAFTAASFADIPVELRLQNVLDDFCGRIPPFPASWSV